MEKIINEPQIINDTKFTIECEKEVNKVFWKKKFIILLGLCLFILSMGIIIVTIFEEDMFYLGVFCLVFGIATPLVQLLMITINIKKSIKTININQPNLHTVYNFYEKEMALVSESDLSKTTTLKRYDTLIKVIETKKYFLLFISENMAYVISKYSFIEGNAIILSHLLQKEINNKKCRYLY